MSLHKQLDVRYYGDRYLRYQLLTAVDIRYVQITLRARIPRTSEQAINRFSNGLSDKRRTAGSTCANWTHSHNDKSNQHDHNDNSSHRYNNYHSNQHSHNNSPVISEQSHPLHQTHDTLYTLGHQYSGDARRKVKTPWSNNTLQRARRFRPQWMRGVKVLFVCVREHRAAQLHSPSEVTKAVRRLMDKQPSALVTFDDVDAVVPMCTTYEETDPKNDDYD